MGNSRDYRDQPPRRQQNGRPSSQSQNRNSSNRRPSQQGGQGQGGQRPSSNGRRMSKKKMRAKRRRRKIFLLCAEIVVLLILAVVGVGIWKLNKINYNPIDDNDIIINEGSTENLKEFTNIALFGVDSRDLSLGAGGHSDAIIIASINNKTKEVRLVSVYRDTCLFVPGDSYGEEDTYEKATEAYFFGGPTAAINMLNTNLDLDITDYVTVNFDALIETIDLLGGIDIEIDDNEQFYINGYMTETCEITGREYTELTESGNVHLNGLQATAFCRIRYGGGDDYKRTERQREVLSLMFEAAKKSDILTINSIIDQVFPMISTSFSPTEIVSLAASAMSYELADTTGFPFDKATKNVTSVGDCVFAVSLETNVIKLHQYLFNDSEYELSNKAVAISDEIIDMSGFYPTEESYLPLETESESESTSE